MENSTSGTSSMQDRPLPQERKRSGRTASPKPRRQSEPTSPPIENQSSPSNPLVGTADLSEFHRVAGELAALKKIIKDLFRDQFAIQPDFKHPGMNEERFAHVVGVLKQLKETTT